MTDEQILKRLAEIEGGLRFTNGQWWVYDQDFGVNLVEWNPLMCWEDLGPLIEKYQPDIAWGRHDGSRYTRAVSYLNDERTIHESLPHAICLAIIEACKDQV